MKKSDNYHKKKSFFEGWYFKQQSKENSIALIPGINISKDESKYAFIQIITEEKAYNVNYDFKDFSISDDKLTIKIKDSIFSTKGLILNIKSKDINIKGRLIYSDITPIKGDIMGPFAYFPFMECFHGVLSLNHEVNGTLTLNNKEIIFNNDLGYIEKDWGRSFPKRYLWVQCNDFSLEDTSIMVSIANIPFLGFEFKGCIAVVYYKGREYRLATYNGVKLVSYDEKGLVIKRGAYKLQVKIKELSPQGLLAPNGGEMVRTIYENLICKANFKFYKKDELIFDLDSNMASFEYVNS